MADASNLRRRRLRFRRKDARKAHSMTVMEHLGELRSRLIRSVVAFAVVAAIAFVLYDPIWEFLLRPLCTLPPSVRGESCRPLAFSGFEGFNIRLKVTAMVAVLFSSPIWLYQIWAFVTPGLTRREKKYAVPFVASAVTLFAIGTTLAYLLLPSALGFLIGFAGENIEIRYRAQDYLSNVGLILLAFGLSFELPLILFFLGLADVVTVEQLRSHRRGAAIGTAALAAIVTPTQDPFTMLALTVPLYLLYELTIAVLAAVKRRRSASQAG